MLEPLTVPGRTDMVTQLMDYVAWAAAGAGLNEAAIYRLSLAVDEIATNIVQYGYENAGRRGDVRIWAVVDDDMLAVYLEDSGVPFDPRSVPPPLDLDRPLEERPDGGLGVFLALWGVDEFHYESRDDINRCTFIVRRPESGADLGDLASRTPEL